MIDSERDFPNAAKEASKVDIALLPEEVKQFARLWAMEMVHNELGAVLSFFRERILEERKQFFKYIGKRYALQHPNFLEYDPYKKKIRSIIKPDGPTYVIRSKDKPLGFTDLAHGEMVKLIQMLTVFWEEHRK